MNNVDFKLGFVKRAMEYGLPESQAIRLVKQAVDFDLNNALEAAKSGWNNLNPAAKGALVGGGLGLAGGALNSGEDEHGETHRLRNALLGGVGGAAVGAGGAHFYDKYKDILGKLTSKPSKEVYGPVLDEAGQKDLLDNYSENDQNPPYSYSPGKRVDEDSLAERYKGDYSPSSRPPVFSDELGNQNSIPEPMLDDESERLQMEPILAELFRKPTPNPDLLSRPEIQPGTEMQEYLNMLRQGVDDYSDAGRRNRLTENE